MGTELAQCVADTEWLPPFLTEPIFKEREGKEIKIKLKADLILLKNISVDSKGGQTENKKSEKADPDSNPQLEGSVLTKPK